MHLSHGAAVNVCPVRPHTTIYTLYENANTRKLQNRLQEKNKPL